jgi:hypothetical protein
LEDGVPIIVEGVQRMREGQAVALLDSESKDDASLARGGKLP